MPTTNFTTRSRPSCCLPFSDPIGDVVHMPGKCSFCHTLHVRINFPLQDKLFEKRVGAFAVHFQEDVGACTCLVAGAIANSTQVLPSGGSARFCSFPTRATDPFVRFQTSFENRFPFRILPVLPPPLSRVEFRVSSFLISCRFAFF